MAEQDRTASSPTTPLSADQAVAAVRVHLDRVHDAVLRTGCPPLDAVEVVRATALALVERSAADHAPADVAVGRWFADARAAGRQVAGPAPGLPGDEQQRGLQAALAALPDDQRLAVLLRDGYDLSLPAVAAALDADLPSAERVLARARAALPSADALHGLTVLGLAPAERHDVLRSVDDLAHRRLPQARQRVGSRRVAAAPAAAPEAAPPPRLLSPLVAALSLVLAVLAGVGAGLVLARQDAPEPLDEALPPGVRLVTPQPSVTALPSPPTVAEVRPRTQVVVVPPSPLPVPTPSPTPSPTATPTPAADPALALSPAGGPNGTTITVTGTGFAPGDPVRIDYLDATGVPTGSGAVAVADDRGSITATLVAQDPLGTPGPHAVVATVGDAEEPAARAEFTAE